MNACWPDGAVLKARPGAHRLWLPAQVVRRARGVDVRAVFHAEWDEARYWAGRTDC